MKFFRKPLFVRSINIETRYGYFDHPTFIPTLPTRYFAWYFTVDEVRSQHGCRTDFSIKFIFALNFHLTTGLLLDQG